MTYNVNEETSTTASGVYIYIYKVVISVCLIDCSNSGLGTTKPIDLKFLFLF